jgi:hypothetical protein
MARKTLLAGPQDIPDEPLRAPVLQWVQQLERTRILMRAQLRPN